MSKSDNTGISKEFYSESLSKKYRQWDDTVTDEPDGLDYCRTLRDICNSFQKKINVLDLGCGTGRFFHCLENVEKLVGMDISENMLGEARHPVKEDCITCEHIELICGNAFEMDIPDESYDFIYSISVLGERAPFDEDMCRKLCNWLRPGGRLLFTVVDAESKPETKSLKRRIAEMLYPILPSSLKRRLDERWEPERLWKSFYLTETELKEILERNPTLQFTITRRPSQTSLWHGVHLECFAEKAAPDQ